MRIPFVFGPLLCAKRGCWYTPAEHQEAVGYGRVFCLSAYCVRRVVVFCLGQVLFSGACQVVMPTSKA